MVLRVVKIVVCRLIFLEFPTTLLESAFVKSLIKNNLREKTSAHKQLAETISYAKKVGRQSSVPYDSIVALSGGKDLVTL